MSKRRYKYPPEDYITGYVKKVDGQTILTDWEGRKIAHGRTISCRKVPPGTRGSWISGERCSYQFYKDGTYYAGRNGGEGLALNARKMKRKPRWKP